MTPSPISSRTWRSTRARRVAISAFALANGRIHEVLLLSPPHQLRFGSPLRVTTARFDPHNPTATGKKHGARWIGDYQGITASAGPSISSGTTPAPGSWISSRPPSAHKATRLRWPLTTPALGDAISKGREPRAHTA